MTPQQPSPNAAAPTRESVWDYPRPPAVVRSNELVRVVHAGVIVAQSRRAVRILETAHAPAYYIPREDVRDELIRPIGRRTWCEYKGRASYGDLLVPGAAPARAAVWWYPEPAPGYQELRHTVSFYPQRVDICEVDGEVVVPLDSDFYGDWPTSRIIGPYKGSPGTSHW